eukprot:6490259-Amphidinium_carterae.1
MTSCATGLDNQECRHSCEEPGGVPRNFLLSMISPELLRQDRLTIGFLISMYDDVREFQGCLLCAPPKLKLTRYKHCAEQDGETPIYKKVSEALACVTFRIKQGSASWRVICYLAKSTFTEKEDRRSSYL